MIIVLTGRMEATRAVMVRRFLEMGIKVSDNVAKNIDYLVMGEPFFSEKCSIKAKEAKNCDVEVVQIDKFMEILDEKFPEYVL